MFFGASSFNQDISRWNVHFVRDSTNVFLNTTMGPRTFCGEWYRVRSLRDELNPVITSEVCTGCICPHGVPVDECTSVNGTNCVECDDGYTFDGVFCTRIQDSAATRTTPWPLHWFI